MIRIWLIVLFTVSSFFLVSCTKTKDKVVNDETPVSYWINNQVGCPHGYVAEFFNVLKDMKGLPRCVADPCITESARAIVESGRPYPNEHNDPITGEKLYDVWIGTHLYEMKAKNAFLINGNFSPKAHPHGYHYLLTSVSDLLSVPDPKFKDPNVGGTLDGYILCERNSNPREYRTRLFDNSSSKKSAIAFSVQRYKDYLKNTEPALIPKIKIIQRKDLNMIEVSTDEKHGAAYFPMNSEITQDLHGKKIIKAVGCTKPYNPDKALNVTEVCEMAIYFDEDYTLTFRVYQQLMPYMPAIHDYILNTLEQAKRN